MSYDDYVRDMARKADNMRRKTCKYCGEENVRWAKCAEDECWVLVNSDDGLRHYCSR